VRLGRKVHEDAVANRWKGKSLLTLYCPVLRFLVTLLLIPIPLCVCLASLLSFNCVVEQCEYAKHSMLSVSYMALSGTTRYE
jgi:hypothetical protein